MQGLQSAVQMENAGFLLQTQVCFASVTVYASTLMIAVMMFHESTANQNQMVNLTPLKFSIMLLMFIVYSYIGISATIHFT